MIIPALVEYYDRKKADPACDVAEYGYSVQKITFEVVVEPNGSLHAISDARVDSDGRQAPRLLIVPGQAKPSGSGLNPCFLWDSPQYILGFKPDDPKPERTAAAFTAFRERHLEAEEQIDDEAFSAVCRFLAEWSPEAAASRPELTDLSGFGVFRILGAEQYVHERPAVEDWWHRSIREPAETPRVPSLTTGRVQPVARLHEPKIKSVANAQSSGATIVSFNQDAFTSYGKDQGQNAPVGLEDAFKYCTALNMLTTDPARRVILGDMTLVAWAERPTPIEDAFLPLLDDRRAEDDAAVREAVATINAVRRGRQVSDAEPDVAFRILGLSPNAARLSVRLWIDESDRELAERVGQHLDDMALEPRAVDESGMSIRRLVLETAPARNGWPDADHVSPLVAGEVLRAILTGRPYPRALLSSIVARCRVEGLASSDESSSRHRKDWRSAQYRRCAIIRACLNRQARAAGQTPEAPVSLNEDHPDTAYQLGRLFAALERAQEVAAGREINATIRDRYFGAAGATPASIFPRLIRVHQHHLGQLEQRSRIYISKMIQGICDRITAFPKRLNLEGQGMFALGYYHQRQSFFIKKDESVAGSSDS